MDKLPDPIVPLSTIGLLDLHLIAEERKKKLIQDGLLEPVNLSLSDLTPDQKPNANQKSWTTVPKAKNTAKSLFSKGLFWAGTHISQIIMAILIGVSVLWVGYFLRINGDRPQTTTQTVTDSAIHKTLPPQTISAPTTDTVAKKQKP